MAQLNDGRPQPAGEHHGQAQVLARDLPDEWTGRVQVQLALLAHSQHRFAEARRCYLAADAALRAARSPLQLGQIQLHLGLLDEMEGDLLSAQERAEAALAQLEAQRRHAYAAAAHALLVNVQAALGRLDLARGKVDALLARLPALQYADAATMCTATVVRVFSELGDAAGMQRAAGLGERLAGSDPGARAAGPTGEAACHPGQAEQARAFQQQAVERFFGAAPALHQALLQANAAPHGAGASAPPGVPRLARLASDSWLPDLR